MAHCRLVAGLMGDYPLLPKALDETPVISSKKGQFLRHRNGRRVGTEAP